MVSGEGWKPGLCGIGAGACEIHKVLRNLGHVGPMSKYKGCLKRKYTVAVIWNGGAFLRTKSKVPIIQKQRACNSTFRSEFSNDGA